MVGCKDAPSQPAEDPQPDPVTEVQETEEEGYNGEETYLGPVEVGNKTHYLMMMSGMGTSVRRYEIIYHTEGMEEIKGQTYYRIHVDTGGSPGKDNFVEYGRIGEDGYYTIGDDDETQTEFMSFPRPIPTEKGASWVVTRPGKDPETTTVVGFETVSILGVTYEDCLKLRREGDGVVITGWLAKGMGSVKIVQQFEYGVLVFLRRPDEEDKKTADGETPPAVED